MLSRDVQVRVVFCDWLAWLMRVKRGGRDVTLTSLLDSRRHGGRVEDTHLPTVNYKVYNTVCI